MNSRSLNLPCVMLLLWGGAVVFDGGCGSVDPGAEPAVSDAAGPSTDKVPINSGEAGDAAAPGSVGQVSPGEGDSAGRDVPLPPEFRLALRNTLDVTIDVTVRQLVSGETRDYSYVSVAPATVSFVAIPGDVDGVLLHVETVDGSGSARVEYHAGLDFDGVTPFEITIDRLFLDPAPDPAPPPDEPDDDDGDGSPSPYAPPVIELLEPANDLSVALGSTLALRWTDTSEAPNAVITLWLEPASGDTPGDDRVQIAPTVAESGDGINDQIHALIQGVEPGSYRVVAEIFDGYQAHASEAPGRLSVYRDALNDAPVITLLGPAMPITVRNGDRIPIQWVDSDADDNASISFSLVSDVAAQQRWTYALGPAVAEDPDGVWDSAEWLISGVLPGVYDLEATITDSQLSGSSRLSRVVIVAPEPENAPPSIRVLEPSEGAVTVRNAVLAVAWDDEDANDNAIISLMLDPDLDAALPDGNEFVMFSALAEDPDGDGRDDIRLGLPPELPLGVYRVLAVITDGRIADTGVSPGLVTVTDLHPGGVEPTPDAAVDIVRDGLPRFVRRGAVFAFDARVRNGELHDISVSLQNDVMQIDPAGAVNWSVLDGETYAFSIDTGLLDIPNEAASRWFDVTVTLSAEGRVAATDTVDAALWLRQEVELLDVSLEGIDCSEPGFGRRGPEPAGLSFAWYGGGFLTDVELPATVEFWLALDGHWPPFLPLGGPQTHHLLMSAAESPGVVIASFIPWEAISHVEPGRYVLLAVVRHPVFGELVAGLDGEPLEICRVEEATGGISLP